MWSPLVWLQAFHAHQQRNGISTIFNIVVIITVLVIGMNTVY
jgi:hypothetical protein